MKTDGWAAYPRLLVHFGCRTGHPGRGPPAKRDRGLLLRQRCQRTNADSGEGAVLMCWLHRNSPTAQWLLSGYQRVLREEHDVFQVSVGGNSRNFSITSSPAEWHERKRKFHLNSHRSTHPAWYNHSFDHPRQSQVIETQHTALGLLQAN